MPIFLFTDIEGSTEKWEKYKQRMGKVLARHDEILAENISRYGGKIVKHTGDGIFAIFEDSNPLKCALEIQKDFKNEDWGEIGQLRIRIGMHAGIAERRGEDYFGPVVNRTARVMAAGWGGQILVTKDVKKIATLPEGATLRSLGNHLLKDLCEPIELFDIVHPALIKQEFPPLRSLSSHQHNLPIQATPFLGREEELKEIMHLLEDPKCRLITLVGPGGIGKTRLALQAAAENIEDFDQGVYFVPLDPLTSVEFLVGTIAQALKFSFYGNEEEKVQLLNYLKEKEMLLILDNFEHLVEGAKIISEILNKAESVKIIVTSRELLNLKGEWLVQLNGMDVPKGEEIDVEGYSAVQLFFYNARRINADVNFSHEDRQFAVRICQLVGGLPLGIEIASSWLRSLSCKEISQEIERNIDFLSTSLRDMPERHRSLRAVFDYSWNLLSEKERDIFMRMSVFHGGFTRGAAEKIADISLPSLTTFIDKSLLRRNPSGRYEMLEIIRQYAAGKLEEFSEKRKSLIDSHCGYYSALLSQKEKEIDNGKEVEVLEMMKEEVKNIRAAWKWAVENKRVKNLGEMLNCLSAFYDMQGLYEEGRQIFEEVADIQKEKLDSDDGWIFYGKALTYVGNFCYHLGIYDKAKDVLNKSISILDKYGVEKEKGFSLRCLGRSEALLGNYEQAMEYCTSALELYKKVDCKKGIANSLNAIGVIFYYMREYEKAEKYYHRSSEISKEMGYEKGITTAIGNIGLVAHGKGEFKKAKKMLEEALVLDRKLNDRMGIANTLHNIGLTYKSLGDFETARKYYEESLSMRREMGDRMGIAISLNNLGNLGGHSVDYSEAKEYHRESIEIKREMGDSMGIAQSLVNLANIFSGTGEHERAKELYRESLVEAVDSGEKFIIRESLLGIAQYLNSEGEEEQGFEIMSFLMDYGKDDEDLLMRVQKEIEKIEPTLSAEVKEKIKGRVKKKKLQDIVGEIISQLII
jgi:predicted ATPase